MTYNIPDPNSFFQISSPERKDQIIDLICKELNKPSVQIRGFLVLDHYFTSKEIDKVLKQLDDHLERVGLFWEVVWEFQCGKYWMDANYHTYDQMHYGPLTLNWKTEYD